MWLLLKRSSPFLSRPYQPPRTVGLPRSQHHQLHNRAGTLGWVTLQLVSFPTRKGSPGLIFLAHRQEGQSHQGSTGWRWERKPTQPQPQTQPHLPLLGWVAWLETQRYCCSWQDCPAGSVCEPKGKQQRAPCLTSTDGEQEGVKP